MDAQMDALVEAQMDDIKANWETLKALLGQRDELSRQSDARALQPPPPSPPPQPPLLNPPQWHLDGFDAFYGIQDFGYTEEEFFVFPETPALDGGTSGEP